MTSQSPDQTQLPRPLSQGSSRGRSGPAQQLALQAALMNMIGGFRLTQAIYVAAKLGVADLLADGPCTAEDLAERTDTHAPSLYRLLRALASVGIFSEDPASRFSLTPMAELLRRELPGSLHGQAVLMGEPWIWQVTGEMLESVRTGGAAFDRLYGMHFWEHLAGDVEHRATFDSAMTSLSALESEAIVATCDLGDASTIVDVGRGRGALLAAILRSHPHMRGVLLEQPQVTDGARSFVTQAGVAERCDVVAGDMFAGVPEGGDVYILKRVIHDWDDDRALAILRCCRSAMNDRARLLLAEPMIAPGNAPHPAKFLDLQMLVSQGGRERTLSEFEELITTAGFEPRRTLPTTFLLTLIEATAQHSG